MLYVFIGMMTIMNNFSSSSNNTNIHKKSLSLLIFLVCKEVWPEEKGVGGGGGEELLQFMQIILKGFLLILVNLQPSIKL